MSTDSPRERLHADGHLTETSFGGVVVRGDELLVITPAGKRVTGLPKGGPNRGETPEQTGGREGRADRGGAARGAGSGGGGGGPRHPAPRPGAARRRPLLVSARRPAGPQD